MEFLIDADPPGRSATILRRHGHEATDVRDIGLGSADDRTVAGHARTKHLCLLTGDCGFADVRTYPPRDYSGIIVLRVPRNATADTILDLIEMLLREAELLARLPGRLAIVEPGRVRVRGG
ncbi:MAG TPA: DUF5615 family PIN-like protein [Phycisphaerae bacterium]|nr:DUF5615 family PIN-like protein [Phycisphaerae bacterium]